MHNNSRLSKLVFPAADSGVLTAAELETLATIVRRHTLPGVEISTDGRVTLVGMKAEQYAAISRALHEEDLPTSLCKSFHTLEACPGKPQCRHAQGDTRAMRRRLAELQFEFTFPAKVKVGISGCPRCCAASWVRDVGLIAGRGGWSFIFGGNAAGRPRIGDLIASGLNDQEAVALIIPTLRYYALTAASKTRSARFMEQIGLATLRAAVSP